MKLAWDPGKQIELILKKRPGFNKVIQAIEKGGLLADTENYSGKYPDQMMLVVLIGRQIFRVPYELREDTCWLITMHRDERLEKIYRRRK